jgi:hypothetical protein
MNKNIIITSLLLPLGHNSNSMPGMGGYGGMAGYGGVSTGTMGASVSGVYGAMGAPPGGFVASLDSTVPPSTQDVDEDEAKEGDDLENVEV